MRIALLVLCALATPVLANQTIWKWVDDRGVTHYSDRSVPGATKMEVSTGAARGTEENQPTYSSSSPPSQIPSDFSYARFEIIRPLDGDTIPNSGGAVPVSVRIEPRLQDGHSLALYVDGRLVPGFPPTAQEYSLTEIPRGTHSLVVIVQDGRGRQVQETRPVSFTVRQESVAQPPVGPALKPPPKAPTPRGASNKMPTQQPSYSALNGAPAKIDPETNLPAKPPAKPAGPRTGN
jgi:hypothetical protein